MQPLNPNSNIALYRQVYQQLRHAILSGTYPPGSKLPSTRSLSTELEVSRITITQAYDLLQAEGYTQTSRGSGTRVARDIPHFGSVSSQDTRQRPHTIEISATTQVAKRVDTVFDPGLFPRQSWSKALREAALLLTDEEVSSRNPMGLDSAREQLSALLLKNSGLHAQPSQIMITSGLTQCISIAIQAFCRTSDLVLVDDPCPSTLRNALLSYGLYVERVDDYLASSSKGKLLKHIPRVIFTSPRSFPCGEVMSITRKARIIDLAKMHGCYVFEDNSDEELRMGGLAASSLRELEPDRVIYASELGRAIAPNLKLGLIVCPRELIPELSSAKERTDGVTSVVLQKALEIMLSSNEYQVQTMRAYRKYAKRRTRALEIIEHDDMPPATVCGQTGLSLVLRLENRADTERMQNALEAFGFSCEPVTRHCLASAAKHENELLANYSMIGE